MCIIIHRPTGAAHRLSRETLKRCADRNPDGYGIMWAHKGKLNTARYLPAERSAFLKRALMLQDADLPMVLHFRWATHGAVTKENTHPFVIKKGESALMHNGILSIPCVKGWSDTRTFVYTIMRAMPKGWETMPTMYWMLDQATLGSKVAVMYKDGSVTILHKAAGISEGGIWYSNDGFRPSLERDEWTKLALKYAPKKGDEKALDSWKQYKATKDAGEAFTKGGKLPIQSSALYRFEGLTICGWCLARESDTDDAVLVVDAGEGEQCELCYHSPHVPGSRDVTAHKGVKHSMHPDAVEYEDDVVVCVGA